MMQETINIKKNIKFFIIYLVQQEQRYFQVS